MGAILFRKGTASVGTMHVVGVFEKLEACGMVRRGYGMPGEQTEHPKCAVRADETKDKIRRDGPGS